MLWESLGYVVRSQNTAWRGVSSGHYKNDVRREKGDEASVTARPTHRRSRDNGALEIKDQDLCRELGDERDGQTRRTQHRPDRQMDRIDAGQVERDVLSCDGVWRRVLVHLDGYGRGGSARLVHTPASASWSLTSDLGDLVARYGSYSISDLEDARAQSTGNGHTRRNGRLTLEDVGHGNPQRALERSFGHFHLVWTKHQQITPR